MLLNKRDCRFTHQYIAISMSYSSRLNTTIKVLRGVPLLQAGGLVTDNYLDLYKLVANVILFGCI